MDNDGAVSYTSASQNIPIKLFLNDEVLKSLKRRDLKPISVNLNLTNKCNLDCIFCSCGDRDISAELDFYDIVGFMDKFDSIKSVILTGGGEPLLYSNLDKLLIFLKERDIRVGLVTNGFFLNDYIIKINECVDWVRISLSKLSSAFSILPIQRELS